MNLRGIVATNLRQMRHAKGLSQEELADRAGINRNYIGMLEREENSATVDMLERIAIVLKTNPRKPASDDLFPNTVNRRRLELACQHCSVHGIIEPRLWEKPQVTPRGGPNQ